MDMWWILFNKPPKRQLDTNCTRVRGPGRLSPTRSGSDNLVSVVYILNKEAIEETIQDLCSKKKTRESDRFKFFGLNHTI